MIETHPLKPYLPTQSLVLMLGSFPPPKNRWKIEFYYPNYNNDMWRILGLIFYHQKNYFVDQSHKTFNLNLIKQFLQEKRISISDVAYQIIRLQQNASDKYLQVIQPMDIAHLLQSIPKCHSIITTGEKATAILCTQLNHHQRTIKIGERISLYIKNRQITLYRLPSSSRAYPLSIEQKAIYYRHIFTQIGLITQ